MTGEASSNGGLDQTTAAAMLGAAIRGTYEGMSLDARTIETTLGVIAQFAAEWTKDPQDPRGTTLRAYLGHVTSQMVEEPKQ